MMSVRPVSASSFIRGLRMLPGALLLAACSSSPPVETVADTGCPELTGSYCATGLKWKESSTELQEAYLPYYLGIKSGPGWTDVDRVDIAGVSEGALTMTLRVGDKEFARTELRDPDLMCRGDRVALRMDAMVWASGVLLAIGGTTGWRVIGRGDDGILRIQEQRRESGTIFLVIPLSFRDDSWLQFRPVGEGGCN